MTRSWPWVVTIAALLSPLVYLAGSWANGYLGFPLDDGWIHQTYARNLVETGQWAFVPGQPSAGSTSPLWTLLLAAGYALHLPYRLWTYALGTLCLLGTTLLAARLAQPATRHLLAVNSQQPAQYLLPLAVALEWHLVWAAVSGMETLLFAALALALWTRVLDGGQRRPFWTGLLGGALILTRPEGILALGLAVGGVALAAGLERRWRDGLRAGGAIIVGTALWLAPYLALNWRLSGTLWPNTFYAKQAEYGVLLSQPLLQRLGQLGTLPLIGGQVLLLPGLLWVLWRLVDALRHRQDAAALGHALLNALPLAWAAATVAVYALRLPVTYQHGRYLIPVVPIVVVYGWIGLQGLARPLRKLLRPATSSLLLHAWNLSLAVLFLLFWLLGARAFATDVAIIEQEMVATARWLAVHAEPDALVAVHDIGAVGYFAPRPLLDLAGLVSPEVVPFIRDEARLLEWMETQGADYLVTFPSWYPQITADPRLESLYRTGAAVTVAQGGENMVVYALHWGTR